MEIVPQIKNSKTTDQFVEETKKETETLNNNINTFINQKIREDLLATNNIKEIYAKSTDLKEKAAKIKELNAKSEILAKLINSEKENLENKIEKQQKLLKKMCWINIYKERDINENINFK